MSTGAVDGSGATVLDQIQLRLDHARTARVSAGGCRRAIAQLLVEGAGGRGHDPAPTSASTARGRVQILLPIVDALAQHLVQRVQRGLVLP